MALISWFGSTGTAEGLSEVIRTRIAADVTAAGRRGLRDLAPVPTAREVEAIVEAAFWAGLRRVEGHDPKVSLALLPPSMAEERALIFDEWLPLSPETLAQLSPAVERPGVHLGVWRESDALFVWGVTRALPSLCFVVEVSEPGLVVAKLRRSSGHGKFGNIAVIRGDQVKVVDEGSAGLRDYPAVLSALLSFESFESVGESVELMVQTAVSMRAHGRGGTLLVVPAGTGSWRESLVWPVVYLSAASAGERPGLLPEAGDMGHAAGGYGEARSAMDAVAGLTAIDGAALMTSTFDLLVSGQRSGRGTAAHRSRKCSSQSPWRAIRRWSCTPDS